NGVSASQNTARVRRAAAKCGRAYAHASARVVHCHVLDVLAGGTRARSVSAGSSASTALAISAYIARTGAVVAFVSSSTAGRPLSLAVATAGTSGTRHKCGNE